MEETFLGKPASYWMELDSFARENLCDKLAEENSYLIQENARVRAELLEKSDYIRKLTLKQLEELEEKNKIIKELQEKILK